MFSHDDYWDSSNGASSKRAKRDSGFQPLQVESRFYKPQQVKSRFYEPQHDEPRFYEPRFYEPRHDESQIYEPRNDPPGYFEPRFRDFQPPIFPNRVLMFTVFNPAFPIDCNIVASICSEAMSSLVRIVIFENYAVHCLVEFDSNEAAAFIMERLQGRQIYENCCTLKVEISKQTKLDVKRNSHRSWDFTNPLNPTQTTFKRNNFFMSYPGQHFGNFRPKHPRDPILIAPISKNPEKTGAKSEHGSVLMLYGVLPQKANPDRVFNLLCLFGNVLKVKFLRTLEGSAMVQMSSPSDVDQVIAHLNNARIFGHQLMINVSNQQEVEVVAKPFQLPDGSPSFVDFQGSTNFRFSENPDFDETDRISAPSQMIYFFDPSRSLTHEDIDLFLANNGAPKPVQIYFDSESNEGIDTETRVTIEFGTTTMALKTVALCNNFPFSVAGHEAQLVVKFWFAK